MSGPLSPWALPGPSAFLGRVCTTLYQSRLAALHAPRDAEGLAAALRARLEADELMRVVALELDEGTLFTSALSKAAGTSANTPVALCAAPELQGAVVLATVRGASAARDAANFARLAQRETSNDTPHLLWLACDQAALLEGCRAEPVRGVFNPLDGMAYVAALPRRTKPLESRVVATVAVETACWDVVLMDRLTALPIEQAVRPDLHVAAWEDGRLSRWRSAALDWEDGSLDDWGGEATPHPAWLAVSQPAQLAKRVWRGQLATLLPWIEQHRVALIDKYRRRLRPDEERSGSSIDLLDWGPLARQLKDDPALATLLQTFRRARNELAHARPLVWSQISLCIEQSKRLC